SGRVIMANNTDGYGNKVLIDHGGGEVTLYAHCSGFAVSAGQTVSQGQTIAYVGSTGNSTGAHLHFEVRINGNYTNPMGYL
ncbi:MAG: M23 family metallopeptidase, partial [Anaerovoracaceae bacterium]